MAAAARPRCEGTRNPKIATAPGPVSPHRARVARGRDDFAKLVSLDAQQRAQLDAGVQEAATAIQDKVMDEAHHAPVLEPAAPARQCYATSASRPAGGRLLCQVATALRVRHYSARTVEAYCA